MKPNTQESFDYDTKLIEELIIGNPALILAGAAIKQHRCFMASDILEASGLHIKAESLIKKSMNFHGLQAATLAFVADKKVKEHEVSTNGV